MRRDDNSERGGGHAGAWACDQVAGSYFRSRHADMPSSTSGTAGESNFPYPPPVDNLDGYRRAGTTGSITTTLPSWRDGAGGMRSQPSWHVWATKASRSPEL
jgi:hypothetical protein